MQVWLELVLREGFFLALLAGLGSGPASFLPDRYGRAGRLAMAPVLGLCVGACVTVTLVYAFPASDTPWMIVVLALASVLLAVRRGGLSLRHPSPSSVLQIALVTFVVVGSFDLPLALRHTVGPDGGYHIADTGGYVSEINGETRESIHQVARARAPFPDLALSYWSGYAQRNQQLDVSALEANANELLGLGSTDTQAPFLIVIVLVGALGVFAAVRRLSDGHGWAAAIAGCLFAGPLFAELFIDGSQAAIAGAALLVPIAVLGVEALSERRPTTLVLFALLAAGLQTVYPLFLPAAVIAGAGAILLLTIRRLHRGRPDREEVIAAAARLMTVLVLAAVFTPVAFSRNAQYWLSLLNGSFSLNGLPAYSLPLEVLPGWLLQTQEFYGLVDLSHADAGPLALAGFLPLILLTVIGLAVWRHRAVLMMLAVAAGAMLLAYYTGAGRGCSYCVQRNLLPIVPLGIAALGLGVAVLASSRSRAGLPAALVISTIALASVGGQGMVERQRLANGSYLLDRQDRRALSALPTGAGAVELEGFGQGPLAPMEEPLAYNLVDERTDGRLSLPTYVDDAKGLFYLGGMQPLGPSFRSDYAYVLTRLAGIRTSRTLVARAGAIALERRSGDLDVTITGGVSVAMARRDPSGEAWVSGPLHFLVVGGDPAKRAWLTLVFARTVPVMVGQRPGLAGVTTGPGDLRICMAALGRAPVRSADVAVSFTPQPPPPTTEPYAEPLPARGLRLVSMTASTRPCAGAGAPTHAPTAPKRRLRSISPGPLRSAR
jgi:MFS family permease